MQSSSPHRVRGLPPPSSPTGKKLNSMRTAYLGLLRDAELLEEEVSALQKQLEKAEAMLESRSRSASHVRDNLMSSSDGVIDVADAAILGAVETSDVSSLRKEIASLSDRIRHKRHEGQEGLKAIGRLLLPSEISKVEAEIESLEMQLSETSDTLSARDQGVLNGRINRLSTRRTALQSGVDGVVLDLADSFISSVHLMAIAKSDKDPYDRLKTSVEPLTEAESARVNALYVMQEAQKKVLEAKQQLEAKELVVVRRRVALAEVFIEAMKVASLYNGTLDAVMRGKVERCQNATMARDRVERELITLNKRMGRLRLTASLKVHAESHVDMGVAAEYIHAEMKKKMMHSKGDRWGEAKALSRLRRISVILDMSSKSVDLANDDIHNLQSDIDEAEKRFLSSKAEEEEHLLDLGKDVALLQRKGELRALVIEASHYENERDVPTNILAAAVEHLQNSIGFAKVPGGIRKLLTKFLQMLDPSSGHLSRDNFLAAIMDAFEEPTATAGASSIAMLSQVLFEFFDNDASDTLDVVEFASGLLALTPSNEPYIPQLLFLALDRDMDGSVTKTEVITFLIEYFSLVSRLIAGLMCDFAALFPHESQSVNWIPVSGCGKAILKNPIRVSKDGIVSLVDALFAQCGVAQGEALDSKRFLKWCSEDACRADDLCGVVKRILCEADQTSQLAASSIDTAILVEESFNRGYSVMTSAVEMTDGDVSVGAVQAKTGVLDQLKHLNEAKEQHRTQLSSLKSELARSISGRSVIDNQSTEATKKTTNDSPMSLADIGDRQNESNTKIFEFCGSGNPSAGSGRGRSKSPIRSRIAASASKSTSTTASTTAVPQAASPAEREYRHPHQKRDHVGPPINDGSEPTKKARTAAATPSLSSSILGRSDAGETEKTLRSSSRPGIVSLYVPTPSRARPHARLVDLARSTNDSLPASSETPSLPALEGSRRLMELTERLKDIDIAWQTETQTRSDVEQVQMRVLEETIERTPYFNPRIVKNFGQQLNALTEMCTLMHSQLGSFDFNTSASLHDLRDRLDVELSLERELLNEMGQRCDERVRGETAVLAEAIRTLYPPRNHSKTSDLLKYARELLNSTHNDRHDSHLSVQSKARAGIDKATDKLREERQKNADQAIELGHAIEHRKFSEFIDSLERERLSLSDTLSTRGSRWRSAIEDLTFRVDEVSRSNISSKAEINTAIDAQVRTFQKIMEGLRYDGEASEAAVVAFFSEFHGLLQRQITLSKVNRK